jgi:hypothetical protein
MSFIKKRSLDQNSLSNPNPLRISNFSKLIHARMLTQHPSSCRRLYVNRSKSLNQSRNLAIVPVQVLGIGCVLHCHYVAAKATHVWVVRVSSCCDYVDDFLRQ